MNNGKMVYACVSFKNTSTATATQIGFFLPLSNHTGQVVDTAHFDRKGTFSPNVEIHGWHDLAEWSSGQGHHGKYDNCVRWQPDNETERVAFTHLQYYSIVVKRIDYADGTVWPTPPATTNEPMPESTATPTPATAPTATPPLFNPRLP